MADEEIKIQISADDQASAKLRAMGETARKTGETARLGMYALGEAAETAGEKMGIPREVSRHLGSSVERMAQSLGVAGVALGAVGLAATSAALIWKNYREEQEKIREEKIKQGQQAGQWLEGILKERAETEGLVKAKNALIVAEFKHNKLMAEKAVPEMVEKIKELTVEYNRLRRIASGEETPTLFRTEKGENIFESASRQAADLNAQIQILVSRLGLTREQAKLFAQYAEDTSKLKKPEDRPWTQAEFGEMRASWQSDQARTQAEVILQIERDKYNALQELKWKNNQQDIKDHDDAVARNDARLRSAQQMASGMATTFALMYQIGGTHARRYFSLYKTAAISETLISTYKSAADSFAFGAKFGGPPLGAAMAAIAVAAGMARVASIRAQTFEGGGGGAVGTFAANPATGLPESSGAGGPSSIIINVNGQQVGVLELTGNVLKTIYNNNGSVDGFSVSVERSA